MCGITFKARLLPKRLPKSSLKSVASLQIAEGGIIAMKYKFGLCAILK
jgi:hypothetical protein